MQLDHNCDTNIVKTFFKQMRIVDPSTAVLVLIHAELRDWGTIITAGCM